MTISRWSGNRHFICQMTEWARGITGEVKQRGLVTGQWQGALVILFLLKERKK
jgi:hypothetical protein